MKAKGGGRDGGERERKEKTRHEDGMLATKGNTVGETPLKRTRKKRKGETGGKERKEKEATFFSVTRDV